MIRYPITKGESLSDAIVKAGTIASASGDNAYVIVCSRCGEPIDEHERPSVMDTFLGYTCTTQRSSTRTSTG